VGCANAGKSTLLNALVGENVSIISSKPQTTRKKIMGICTTDQYQIIFVDGPGAIKADSGLNQFLQNEYESLINDSDALIAVLNIDENDPEKLEEVLRVTSESGKPWVAVINKADLKQKHRVELLRFKVKDFGVPCISGSAVKSPQELQKEILSHVVDLIPKSRAPFYSEDIFTTQNLRDISAEVIREKCFESLYQEIPYHLAVNVRQFDETRDDLKKIHADIVVAKENHKSIVIGEKAKKLKQIGTRARKDLEAFLGTQVFLDLRVDVKSNWTKNKKRLKELGYGVRNTK